MGLGEHVSAKDNVDCHSLDFFSFSIYYSVNQFLSLCWEGKGEAVYREDVDLFINQDLSSWIVFAVALC